MTHNDENKYKANEIIFDTDLSSSYGKNNEKLMEMLIKNIPNMVSRARKLVVGGTGRIGIYLNEQQIYLLKRKIYGINYKDRCLDDINNELRFEGVCFMGTDSKAYHEFVLENASGEGGEGVKYMMEYDKKDKNCQELIHCFMSDKIWCKDYAQVQRGLSILTNKDLSVVVYQWCKEDVDKLSSLKRNGITWDRIRDYMSNITSHFLPYPGEAKIIIDYSDRYKCIIRKNNKKIYEAEIIIYILNGRLLCILRHLKRINKKKFKNTDLDYIEGYINQRISNNGAIKDVMQRMKKKCLDGMKHIIDDSMIKVMRGHCGYCQGKITNKSRLCTGCRGTYYCCKRCLKLDWKNHRERCFLNRISFEKGVKGKETYLHDWH